MPYLKIQTNVNVEDKTSFIKKISPLLSKELGKPEQYIMIALAPKTDMLFSGSPEPTAFLELKSIGLQQGKNSGISEFLCNFMQEELKIPSNRVYIEFTSVDGKWWGWNKGTF